MSATQFERSGKMLNSYGASTLILAITMLTFTVQAMTSNNNGKCLNLTSKMPLSAVEEMLIRRDFRCHKNCTGFQISTSNNRTQMTELLQVSNETLALMFNLPCTDEMLTDQVPEHKTDALVWLYGFIACSVLNVASQLGWLVGPFMKKPIFPWIMSWMIGIGLGSMCTVSVLNLIPDALDVQADKLQYTVTIVIAIYAFYLSDRLLQCLQRNRASCIAASTEQALDGDDLSETDSTKVCGLIKPVTSIAEVPVIVYMVLLSDGLHNFVDGLTVGVAFAQSPKQAVGLTLAILFEELPCELGDFAIFLKAGLKIKHASILNLIGASPNYVGMVIGIAFGDIPNAHFWIYAIAGGMFLYISLGIMLGEMIDLQWKMLKSGGFGRWLSVKILAVQNVGIIMGFTMQLLIVICA